MPRFLTLSVSAGARAGERVHQPLELAFSRADIGTIFLAVLIGAIAAADGRSTCTRSASWSSSTPMIAIPFDFLPAAAG